MDTRDHRTEDGPEIDDYTLEFAVQLFSALAHPTRLRIVELLTFGSCTVNEIAHFLRILQPNASQHLAILNRAGVVKVTPDGVVRNYSLRGPRIARVLRLVNEFRSIHIDDLEELEGPELQPPYVVVSRSDPDAVR
ncbi:MAG: ArsR/SmtB family transcription factor [Capsulimonadaceae bacterium]